MKKHIVVLLLSLGHPNVGKSTLLNKLVGKKISITSRKAKTTRNLIIGIYTKSKYQSIYIDTPGLHMEENCTFNEKINKITDSSIIGIKLIIFVIEGTNWTRNDEVLLNKLREEKVPVILVINKVDNIKKKQRLLPYLKFLAGQMNFLNIIPVSAETGINVDVLSEIVRKNLPEATHFFPKDYATNCSKSFMVSEIIREKLIRFLERKISCSASIEIERIIANERRGYNIDGVILVKQKWQKKIVIGKNGSKIKIISTKARKDIQEMYKSPIYLSLWVKEKLN